MLWAKREAIRDPEFRSRIARSKSPISGSSGLRLCRVLEDEIQFRHRSRGGDKTLDFASESLGTQSWFALAAALLKALEDGAVLGR